MNLTEPFLTNRHNFDFQKKGITSSCLTSYISGVVFFMQNRIKNKHLPLLLLSWSVIWSFCSHALKNEIPLLRLFALERGEVANHGFVKVLWDNRQKKTNKRMLKEGLNLQEETKHFGCPWTCCHRKAKGPLPSLLWNKRIRGGGKHHRNSSGIFFSLHRCHPEDSLNSLKKLEQESQNPVNQVI